MSIKPLLIILFGLAAVWDAITTVVGTKAYLGTTNVAVPIFVALVITAFMVGTKQLWRQREGLGIAVKVLWCIAFAYDVFTSYIGNLTLVMGGETEKLVFLLGITVLTSGAPILISLIFDQD